MDLDEVEAAEDARTKCMSGREQREKKKKHKLEDFDCNGFH